jgi:germination protein M
MNRTRSLVLPSLALVGLLLATAACGTSGGLGPVPTTPPTAAPSADPGPPDVTPDPSASPSPSGSPSGSPDPSASPTGSPDASPSASPSASPETMVIRAYYVLDGDQGVEGLVPTLRVVPKTAAVARAALEALLDAEATLDRYRQLSSAIPSGTKLLGIAIKDGIATVDLSSEFESGGGSSSSFYRLGQVVYTLTQFSTVNAVRFEVEGRTVTTFGSEGIILEGPQARADFEDQLPSIFVDRPAFAAAAGNPVRITGNANVFEASFLVAIIDGSGKVLVEQPAMATCGTGCRGTFDVTLRYTVAKAQWGTLRVYFGSAQDGRPEDVRDYPVWLTPAG